MHIKKDCRKKLVLFLLFVVLVQDVNCSDKTNPIVSSIRNITTVRFLNACFSVIMNFLQGIKNQGNDNPSDIEHDKQLPGCKNQENDFKQSYMNACEGIFTIFDILQLQEEASCAVKIQNPSIIKRWLKDYYGNSAFLQAGQWANSICHVLGNEVNINVDLLQQALNDMLHIAKLTKKPNPCSFCQNSISKMTAKEKSIYLEYLPLSIAACSLADFTIHFHQALWIRNLYRYWTDRIIETTGKSKNTALQTALQLCCFASYRAMNQYVSGDESLNKWLKIFALQEEKQSQMFKKAIKLGGNSIAIKSFIDNSLLFFLTFVVMQYYFDGLDHATILNQIGCSPDQIHIKFDQIISKEGSNRGKMHATEEKQRLFLKENFNQTWIALCNISQINQIIHHERDARASLIAKENDLERLYMLISIACFHCFRDGIEEKTRLFDKERQNLQSLNFLATEQYRQNEERLQMEDDEKIKRAKIIKKQSEKRQKISSGKRRKLLSDFIEQNEDQDRMQMNDELAKNFLIMHDKLSMFNFYIKNLLCIDNEQKVAFDKHERLFQRGCENIKRKNNTCGWFECPPPCVNSGS